METGRDVRFEVMSKEVLAETLWHFYPSARQKPDKSDPEGEPKKYVKQSLINIRPAINRHLQLPPYNKTWDLTNDKDFIPANKVFKGTKNLILPKAQLKLKLNWICKRHLKNIKSFNNMNSWLHYSKQIHSIFSGNLRIQKKEGLDVTKSHHPLSKAHIEQICRDYFIPHYDNDPVCLMHKVYFDIAYFLGKCGTEGLRELKKNSFGIFQTDNGRDYI